MKSLSHLIKSISPLRVVGHLESDIADVQFDSRKVHSKSMYVATRGFTVDGHQFINKSINAGATAIVCEELPKNIYENVTYVLVANAREALALIANAYYDFPSKSLKLFGVTGTNGKTTTATLMYQLASKIGLKSGLLSTVANYVDRKVVPSTHTTGDAIQICSLLSEMVKEGCTHCFMEVTSHALDQKRTDGLEFDVGIFTNLSQDHLDYHGTMEAYAGAKKIFFDTLPTGSRAILNCDDPAWISMSKDTKASIETYGRSMTSDYTIEDLLSTGPNVEFKLRKNLVKSRLSGDFNAYNLTAAIVALAEESDVSSLAASSQTLSPVAGRLQKVTSGTDVVGFVDFAHTPDAVANVLSTLRGALPSGARLITVLGCGGDRDQGKRPEMARLALELSDFLILTSDNPRSEDPKKIIEDMKAGIPVNQSSDWCSEVDRKAAIHTAVHHANPNDFVLVAGKGHEKYQEIQGEKYEFNDVLELEQALKNLQKKGAK